MNLERKELQSLDQIPILRLEEWEDETQYIKGKLDFVRIGNRPPIYYKNI